MSSDCDSSPDTRNPHPAQKIHFQSPADELIRSLISKDQLIEVVRVPTHILDTILHAEPVDDFIKAGSVDVTRVNLTHLRSLVRVLEDRTEKIALSRWRTAEMGPVAQFDLPGLPHIHFHAEKQCEQARSFKSLTPSPEEYGAGEMTMENSEHEKENAVDEQSLVKEPSDSRTQDENKEKSLGQQIPVVSLTHHHRSKKRKIVHAHDSALEQIANTLAAAAAAVGMTVQQSDKFAAAAAMAAARRSAVELHWECSQVWNPPPPATSTPSLPLERSIPIDYRTLHYRKHHSQHEEYLATTSRLLSSPSHHQQPTNYREYDQYEHSSQLQYSTQSGRYDDTRSYSFH